MFSGVLLAFSRRHFIKVSFEFVNRYLPSQPQTSFRSRKQILQQLERVSQPERPIPYFRVTSSIWNEACWMNLLFTTSPANQWCHIQTRKFLKNNQHLLSPYSPRTLTTRERVKSEPVNPATRAWFTRSLFVTSIEYCENAASKKPKLTLNRCRQSEEHAGFV